MSTNRSLLLFSFLAQSLISPTGRAAELQASDRTAGDVFGAAVSVSGISSLVGSPYVTSAAYLFRNLATASGTVTESAKLILPGGAGDDEFGAWLSLSGGIGVVTTPNATVGANERRGAAYLFRNLETAGGTITESAKLIASDGASEDLFGISVSVSGSMGLLGALDAAWGFRSGSAYLFRSLDTATGTVTQSAKLVASDGAAEDQFGQYVSLSGTTALVGTFVDDGFRGSAYVFRNLDVATGTVTQNAKLTASDRAAHDGFANSVSVSGNLGLVGAPLDDVGANADQGSAYLFRNLDTAAGSVTENANLVASDGRPDNSFGVAVSLSRSVGLVGAPGADGMRGSAYLFLNLDTASGTVPESVKLVASTRGAEDFLGGALSLDGDLFVIAAGNSFKPADKAYSGSVNSVTTLDVGDAARSISGISFTSRTDWVIGETTDANQVNLGQVDKAHVTAAGKAVFIGKNAGSDRNVLRIDGMLTSNEVYIGALAGNRGNTLQLENTASFQAIAFRLAPENLLKIEGDYTAIGNLLTYLGSTDLKVWNGSVWQDVDSTNHTNLITSFFSSGYTGIRTIPAPGVVPVAVLLNPRRSEVNGNASFHFDLLGEAGRTYQLQSSPALTGWTNMNTVTLSAPLLPIEIAIPPGQAQQFYRAIPQ